ncbi:MAG: cob(I)yrinic acid a,c-diamide adenosyltransferase [Streptosporangiaceae bacterium]
METSAIEDEEADCDIANRQPPDTYLLGRNRLFMKIYTRKGDSGQTSIWGGRRLSKDHVRMEAIGAVDECNAAIGSVLATGVPETLSSTLRAVQGRLFIVGSELMAPDHTGGGSALPRLAEGDVSELETAIDSLEQTLPELRNFILPSGTAAAAALHGARGVCRRAERRVATLSRAEGTVSAVPAYLNRLADMLFVAARYANHEAGITDTVWSGQASR